MNKIQMPKAFNQEQSPILDSVNLAQLKASLFWGLNEEINSKKAHRNRLYHYHKSLYEKDTAQQDEWRFLSF